MKSMWGRSKADSGPICRAPQVGTALIPRMMPTSSTLATDATQRDRREDKLDFVHKGAISNAAATTTVLGQRGTRATEGDPWRLATTDDEDDDKQRPTTTGDDRRQATGNDRRRRPMTTIITDD